MNINGLKNNKKLIKNLNELFILIIFSIGIFSGLAQNISAQEETLPKWLKNIAVWWGEEKISDDDFINTLQYLIDNKILVIPPTEIPISSCGPGLVLDATTNECVIQDKSDTQGIFLDTIDEQQKIVVSWIKVTTLWWGQDKLSDQDFINALQYLVENNVLSLDSKIQSKSITKDESSPSNTLVWPKIGKIDGFKIQGNKNAEMYQLQFNLLDINKSPITPDGTISIVILDDDNRILYLDAFSIKKSNYVKSYDAFGTDKNGKSIFTWKIKTSNIKSGFTEYGKAKLMFTDRFGNNIESEFIPISVPKFK